MNISVSNDAPEAHIARLEQRVAELEQQVDAYQRAEQAQSHERTLLRAIFDQLPSSVYAKDPELRYTMANFDFVSSVGLSIEEIIGKTDAEIFPAEYAASYMALDREVVATGKMIEREELAHDGTREYTFLSRHFALNTDDGACFAVCGISTNVSALKQAERERERLQQDIIQTQQQTLRDLSTPLIPLTTAIVVMPLIGEIDTVRLDLVLERLLDGITVQRATTAIIDITGVPVIDALVAAGLLRVAQAAMLLGARIMLTGIRPEIAQTLVSLGVDLRAVVTYSTLQDGVAKAMRL